MERKNNELIIIPKIEKYIEYMLTILIKLPRTEKFNMGTEIKTSMYEMLKYILLASKIDKRKRLEIYNIVDSHIYYQRICIRIMYNNKRIKIQSSQQSEENTNYWCVNNIQYKCTAYDEKLARDIIEIAIIMKNKKADGIYDLDRLFKEKREELKCLILIM